MNNYGTLVLYTLIASNLFASITHILAAKESLPEYVTTLHSTIWPIIFTMLVIVPLCFIKKFSALRYSNFFCLILAVYLVFLVIFKCFQTGNFLTNFSKIEVYNPKGFKISFPIVIFNYAYQSNVPILLKDLQETQVTKVNKVLKHFLLSAASLYIVIGIFGYLLFAGDPLSLNGSKNVAQALAYEGWLISAASSMLLVGISITLAIISTIRSCKEELKIFMHNRGYLEEKPIFSGGWLKHTKKEYHLRDYGYTFAIVISQMLCAVYIQRIIEMIDILGAITLPLVAYNLPCLFYLKIEHKSKWTWKMIKCHILNIAIAGLCAFYIYIYFTEDDDIWGR